MTREELADLKLPDGPGIYQFRSDAGEILYIGKAASLRDRTRSYFAHDLAETRSTAIRAMVESAATLTWIETHSVLEALILEANLIKEHQPTYNIRDKDNKSFNYLVVTKEAFPRLEIVRGRELFQKLNDADIKKLFGPFPEGGSLKEALKIVRKIFPYRDSKCTPCGTGKNLACRPCFNRQIGLCPGVCTGEVDEKQYAIQLKHLTELFSGNFQGLKRQLTKEMKAAAAAEKFEEAKKAKRQIDSLEHVRDVSLIKSEHRVAAGGGARIEAYDTAHTSGVETVAVMTVVQNGEMIKDAYRKFKIQTAGNNDVAALKEVLSRRLNHAEWPLPRVFVIDGGKAQFRAAESILREAGISIPIVGVVKNEYHRPERLIGDTKAIAAYEKDIILANGEAHRFSIEWHRKRRNARSFA